MSETLHREIIHAGYRQLARRLHDDAGGNAEDFKALKKAEADLLKLLDAPAAINRSHLLLPPNVAHLSRGGTVQFGHPDGVCTLSLSFSPSEALMIDGFEWLWKKLRRGARR